jgi:basic membrane lipoprotein Med (substrate-binding protein (PBP1-ABC) superfamily)
MPISFDASKSGLGTVLKDYQETALRYLWQLGCEGAGSHEVWVQVNQELGTRTIIRASIINFLDSMVNDGILAYTETTGKGGYRRIYSFKYDEAGFKEHIAKVIIRNLLRDFPEETRKVLKGI